MSNEYVSHSSAKLSTNTPEKQSKFHAKTTAKEVVEGLKANLEGKVVLITGATSGIGVETARALASIKAHIIITARDMKKGADVVADITKTTSNPNVEVMELHQDSLQSVRKFADEYIQRKLPLNILICNAGIMACPYQKTEDGFESQLAVNHLSHFLLTMLLLPVLKASKPSRVIVVSSIAHRWGNINFDDVNFEKSYDKWKAYGQAKTANILFAKQFSKLYANEGVQAFSLHPGAIMSGLQKDLAKEEMDAMGWFNEEKKEKWKNVEEGASTTVWAALAPELNGKAGEYLEDCAISSKGELNESDWAGMAPHACDMKTAEWLWDLSGKMTGL